MLISGNDVSNDQSYSNKPIEVGHDKTAVALANPTDLRSPCPLALSSRDHIGLQMF
ncbi:hypothetical protein GCM10007939_25290 [Amylibacter marinus]|uniref:Uncharacterized protein n=1 Tax=Amylibacter marinus TaxID=1475483 RepID=A0ABQ5VXU1_9RHOB|nr:hypothetical protein GCM10007939_25290 [Amylibacter marinus]